MRRPPWERFTPGQVFVLFVAWCMLGVIGTVATLLFFPWSLPFALIAIVAGAYIMARVLAGSDSN